MSIFNSIKKLVSKNDGSPSSSSPSSVTSSPSKSTFGQRYDLNTFHCGLYDNATSIHYDCAQRLLAVGFNNGLIKIFGLNGMECYLNCDANTAVLKLIFLVNSPFILVVTSNSIEKWNYEEKKLVNILNFKSRITSIGYSFGCNFIYIGDETGVIQVYNIITHFLSSYKITLDQVILTNNNTNNNNNIPTYPSAIDICPNDNNLLLIGYSNGLVITWNIECKRIEKSFNMFKSFVTKLVWSRKASKFVCGFYDGCVYVVDYPKALAMLVYKPIGLSNDSSERVSIDQLELVYTKDKKIILFKGYFHSPSSLIMIKGENYKEIQNLSVSQVSPSITSFVPVLEQPFPLVKELVAILTLTPKNEIIYYKFDNIMIPTPLDELNLKNMTNSPPILAECYECDIKVKELLEEAFLSNSKSPINGGYIKHSRIFQLKITVHADQTLKFWDFTDSKSCQLLGKVEGIPQNPIAMSFSPVNLILAISFADGQVLIYNLSNISRRIEKSIYPTPSPQPSQQTLSPQQIQQVSPQETSPPQQNVQLSTSSSETTNQATPTNDITSSPTEQSQSTKSSNDNIVVPQPVQQLSPTQQQILSPVLQLPDPQFSGCQLMSEFKFPQPISSIVLNTYKSSSCIRVILGSANGCIYHIIISIISNSNMPGVTASRTVYKSTIDFRGMSPPLIDTEGKVSPITSLSLCFMPFRANEDISILHAGTESGSIFVLDLSTLQIITAYTSSQHPIQSIYYLDKNGRPLQYVFIDLPSFDNLSIQQQTSPTQENQQQIASPQQSSSPPPRIDELNLLVTTKREVIIFSVPTKQIATLLNSTAETTNNLQPINHERLQKEDTKNIIVKSFLFRDIGSDQQFISLFDQSNQFLVYTLQGLSRMLAVTIPNNNSSANIVCSTQIGNIFVITNNSNYSLCLQPSSQRHHYQFFNQGITLPPAPPPQSSLAKFFFGKAPVKIEDSFSEGVTVQQNHASKQKVYVEQISSQLAETVNALNERGRKINDLQEKTSEMENASMNFAQMAKQLRKQNESWF